MEPPPPQPAIEQRTIDGGDEERKTLVCRHDFYLARIERIMTSKCVSRQLSGFLAIHPKLENKV